MKNAINHYNYKHKQVKVKGKSLTIPGEALSVRDLYLKHSTGIVPPIIQNAVYSDSKDHDDLDMEKILQADFVDKEEYLEQHKEKLENAIAFLKEKKKLKEKEKLEREEEKQKKLELKAKNKKSEEPELDSTVEVTEPGS